MNAPKEILYSVHKQLYRTHSQPHTYSNIYFLFKQMHLSCFVCLITKDKAQLLRLIKTIIYLMFKTLFFTSPTSISYTA
ncbi:hypothetical protein XELAEV_18014772mg [Xenopus laevis]|uniref:Uncharacterized protein n=1 Tax=Xenopus laevis TaxID=8355 RepID=A0A974DGU8_XENLA|nr:hypothetical protein XELAEV_18014772mg [Xenopus laevis]